MSEPGSPPADKPQLHSRVIEQAEWASAIDALVAFLREAFPDTIVTAEYGFGCHIHADLTYVSMRIGVGWLDRFFRDSIEQRIFIPGESDLYVHTPQKELSLLFCHEADIHVACTDRALLQKLFSIAPFSQFAFPDT
jgi:hypothetical protein